MTPDEFENLDVRSADEWVRRRFRQFADSGFPPDLALIFAVHPDVDVPNTAPPSDDSSGLGTAA
jgi:hypothetical protein